MKRYCLISLLVATLCSAETYVLETPYQQLVFSDVGGALAEINLPFAPPSIVREVEVDRRMREEHPEEDMFPMAPYKLPGGGEGKPVLGGYHPLIRRGAEIPPRLFVTNIIARESEVAQTRYSVSNFTDRSITFEGGGIRKTYTLTDLPYVFDLEIEVSGKRELYLTTGVPDVEIVAGSPTSSLKYRMQKGGKFVTKKISLPKIGRPFSLGSITPDWVSNSNGFFGIILDPIEGGKSGLKAVYVQGDTAPSRLVLLDGNRGRWTEAKLPGYAALLPVAGSMKVRVYAGPYSTGMLNSVDKQLRDTQTGKGPNYRSAKSFHGIFSFISEPFAKLLFVIMSLFHWFTRSWAASIILLTVFLRVILYPLSAWSMKSMRRMQQLAPQVTALKERYKKDSKRQQMEIMQLYRRERVNPFMGCFPLLIQMPFLVGMFDLLKSTFALRGVGFIPGWINDLTAPDVLFTWSKPIFFFGTEFHLLPFLLGAAMYLQQRFSSSMPKDKSEWTDQQKQQRTMGKVMVVFFTFLFYNFPSGLNIYWLSSMLLSVGQQWLINRQLDKKFGKGKVSGRR